MKTLKARLMDKISTINYTNLEAVCSDVMGNIHQYQVDINLFNKILTSTKETLDRSLRDVHGLGFSGKHNSSKDVATFIESLGLGVTIPTTGKGSKSITSEWLYELVGRHPFFQAIFELRSLARKVSSLETFSHAVTLNSSGYSVPTTWSTLSDTGSPTFTSSSVSLHLLPLDVRACLEASNGHVWYHIFTNTESLLIPLAREAGDTTLLSDILSPEPLKTIGGKLACEDTQGFIFKLLHGCPRSFERFTDLYPDTRDFLSTLISEASSSLVMPVAGGSQRSVTPLDNLKRIALRSFTVYPSTYQVKKILAVLPTLESSTIFPEFDGLWVSFPEGLTPQLSSWVLDNFGDRFHVQEFSKNLGVL